MNQWDELPETIKSVYPEKVYWWLSDAEKKELINRECEPETE